MRGQIVHCRGETEFPDLYALIGGYFHQDFDINGNQLEQIIASFKWRTTPAIWRAARADVLKFLSEREADKQVAEHFETMFNPGVIAEGWDGMTTRQWLERIAELLLPEPPGVTPAPPPSQVR